jgi:hypothetical protein
MFAVECYQERVWNGLQSLRAEIGRHLARHSQKQGSFARVSAQVVVGKEAWRHLATNVEAHTRPLIAASNATMSKRVLEPGLLLFSHRACLHTESLRFETDNELRALSSVLGELVTMDVRKRRPKYGVVELLLRNDIINVVAGSVVREEPFRVRTTMQGIDFVYDGTKVRIRMRCSRHQYATEGSPSTILNRVILRKRLLGPGEDDSSDDDDDDDAGNEASLVVTGRQFNYRDRVYEVEDRNMEDATVSAKVVWPTYYNERVDEFSFEDVLGFVRLRLAQEEE